MGNVSRLMMSVILQGLGLVQGFPSAINGSGASKQTVSEQSKSEPTMQLSTDEIYALQKLHMQKELENEIISWVQVRFWFLVIVSILIGFFGIRAFVREFVATELKEAMRASVEAQAAASSARESIKEVRSEASKYKDLVDSASSTADSVNMKLQDRN